MQGPSVNKLHQVGPTLSEGRVALFIAEESGVKERMRREIGHTSVISGR